MAVLLENTTNTVWQAFISLQQDDSGFVHKSKLKVLTANIGTVLDLYGVEKGLEHFRSSQTLNFIQFKYYLQKEVFSSLPDKLSLTELRNYESNIADICWRLCKKQLIPRKNSILPETSIFQIFRTFSVLAELIPDSKNENGYQVLLHPSEARYVSQKIAKSLGSHFEDEDFINLNVTTSSIRLSAFIALIESKCLAGITDSQAISEAITNIYQTIVEDVIKKGLMTKKGYIFPTMREYWFVLRPSELTYFKTRTEKDRCGSIPIESGSRIESRSGNKIALCTPDRTFEFGTTDYMTRLQWISALQLAADHADGSQSYQRLQFAKRKLLRRDRFQEMVKAKAQLQQERIAREMAEDEAKELKAVVIEETKKLNDLEELKKKLEKLLVEETQAKRDEEIVRNLQARVLAEEWEKREELERLQEEQRLLLEEERGKRLEFEELQRRKEKQLRDAEERLKQLENEKQLLDDQLRIAHQNIKKSENEKEIVEARLHQVSPTLRSLAKVRRTQSFIPSTKEKPVILKNINNLEPGKNKRSSEILD
ncbi:switch-associated protein 70-like [Harmonia axyridis]|uniref:switch-associated protein 70-like n=1 Tax=Harmonia axyridis TaxID=115357 RepID=UPI001E277FCB|nr:switch-associated protein 70-like [Harmonia axyridis]